MKKMNPTPSRRQFLAASSSAFLGSVLWRVAEAHEVHTADVCVYGGTASGVMAAVAAAREGARVLVIEPSRWLGGMTGGGLIHIDWGRKEAVGGSTRSILEQGLNDPQYRDTFARLLQENRIRVLFEHRLCGVEK
jgi:NADPH-dependent 2,4-dienoyl-CoA reductase/sulfur reductase-like enzyme